MVASDSQIALEPMNDDGSQRELIDSYAASGTKIVRHGIRGRARIQERQHAVEKAFPPPRIEPTIYVRSRQVVSRKSKLPFTGCAVIERTAPMGAKSRR